MRKFQNKKWFYRSCALSTFAVALFAAWPFLKGRADATAPQNPVANATEATPFAPMFAQKPLDKALVAAIDKSDVAKVTALLQRGAKPRYVGEADWPPLICAIFGKRDTRLLRVLLNAGARVDEPMKGGTTPLRLAEELNRLEMVELLLQCGANPNLADKNGISPLEDASYRGYEKAVRALLEKGARVNVRDRIGKTPLFWALYNGHNKIAELLKGKGAIAPKSDFPINSAQRHLDESLIDASSKKDSARVKDLLKKGANADALADWTGAKEMLYLATPFQSCLFYGTQDSTGHQETVDALLANMKDVDARGIDGATPLMLAAKSGDVNLAKRLIARGANVNAASNNGATALLGWAPNDQMLRYLVLAGANVNAADDDGFTALLAGRPRLKNVQFLVSHGANLHARTKNGVSVLMKTIDEDTLKFLLNRKLNINAQNNQGQTALMLSPFRPYGEGGVDIDVHWAKVLIRHGAKVNLRDENGNSALMLAASANTSNEELQQFAQLLLRHGARTDFRNKVGFDAVQMARKANSTSFARWLQSAASHVH